MTHNDYKFFCGVTTELIEHLRNQNLPDLTICRKSGCGILVAHSTRTCRIYITEAGVAIQTGYYDIDRIFGYDQPTWLVDLPQLLIDWSKNRA